jgi:acetoacetyl-CoA synthetase
MKTDPHASPRPTLWEPSAEYATATELHRYQRWLAAEGRVEHSDYEALWQWSVDDLPAFWRSIWDFYGVEADGDPTEVLVDATMPGAIWFPDVRVNYAERILEGRDDDAIALLHLTETRDAAEVTWAQLRDAVGRARAGLRAAGVTRGDRVAAYLPNILEAVVGLLATTSLGAIWSCVAPEVGTASALDRFRQIDPTVLIGCDGYVYGGRRFTRCAELAAIARELPTVRQTVLVELLGEDTDAGALTDAIPWPTFCAHEPDLAYDRVPFDHPLWILYSSGTTGAPKAIVHGHGGILLEHLKKLHLHTDLRPGDRFLWFTSTSWMMWNFLVGGLLTDATVVLYDGSPNRPDTGRMWDIVAELGVTCFGTSAGFLAASAAEGQHPRHGRDLSSLRAVGSTGSPLTPDMFRWVYDELGPDLWLFSSSGGTDVCTSFLGGVPTKPVLAGELQGRSLGAAIAAFDADRQPLVDAVGELVLTQPMPSMPVFFWSDPAGERYRSSYFETFPGIWRHGDWVEITSAGGAVIYGRSDSTINRGGIRMGTSEIYRVVLRLARVVDALAVDVPNDEGSTLELYVVLTPGTVLDPHLEREIAAHLRADGSPRHVPDVIRQVDAVPRTRSGKLLELPVKRILMGADPDAVLDRDALQDASALDPFVALAADRRPVGAGPAQ